METEIGIMGHIGHGVAILMDVTKKQSKTINEIIEDDRIIKFTAPLIELNFKSGKESRRERRDKERNANKKHKY